MSEELQINNDFSLDEQYQSLIVQIKNLIGNEYPLISNISNFTAALKQSFNKISWVGFYFYDGNKLFLGPFQGKIACTTIEMGKGVCGTSALERKTIIVPDVNKFPGHIFCDADSKSEIVIPLINKDKLLGVLDIDSDSYDSFNDTDKYYLEEMCSFLIQKVFNHSTGIII